MPDTTCMDFSKLQTEGRNGATDNIDVVSTVEMCRLINEQDQTVALAVSKCIDVIAEIVDQIAPRVRQGGRVIYMGAGTSGRLGILDASEIPPTFSAPYGQWIGQVPVIPRLLVLISASLIAGGSQAIQYAVEGAEDEPETGVRDLQCLSPALSPDRDTVIGLAASGRTPYVLGALEHARKLGCFTAGVCCVRPSGMRGVAEMVVECPVGPEAITGSTRMKSGTAQKMIINMISTGCQIRIGKTYGNLMVDVKRSNLKLVERARRIFRSVLEPLTGPPLSIVMGIDVGDDDAVDRLIEECDGSVKRAMVSARWSCCPHKADARLDATGGVLKKALGQEHS